MRKCVVGVAVLAGIVLLAGCHPIRAIRNVGGSCHDAKPYQKAASIAPLKIPAGLEAPDTSTALHIPALNTPEPPARKLTDPCLEQPPPFNTPKQAPPQA